MPPRTISGLATFILLTGWIAGVAEAAPSPRPPWISDGATAHENRGDHLAGLGDVNGDDFADFAIATPFASGVLSRSGRIDVYYGRPGGPGDEPDLRIWGDRATSGFGCGVAAAGDVDGDGFGDVLVGACRRTAAIPNAGAVFLFRGSAAGLGPSPSWIYEGEERDLELGGSLSTAGDVDGDGYADVLIGAPRSSPGAVFAGKAMLFRGGGTGLGPTPDWSISGSGLQEYLGAVVAGGGDLDGDGLDDFAVRRYPPGGPARLDVYRGSATGISASPAWVVEASATDFGFGSAARISADIDGDGFDDLVVSASQWNDADRPGRGRVMLYSGSADGPSRQPTWAVSGTQSYEGFGARFDAGGDVNGDGLADLVVGAANYDHGERSEGRALVFLGAAGGPSTRPAWSVESHRADGLAGRAVALPGDIDGDGYAEVLVGIPYFGDRAFRAGRVALYFGEREKANPVATCPPTLQWACDCGGAGAASGFLDGSASHHPLARAIAFDWNLPDCALSDRTAATTPASCPLFHHPASLIVTDGELDDQCHFAVEVIDDIPPLEGEPAYSIASPRSGSWFGYAVASAGDVNGDGRIDIVVGDFRVSETFEYEGAAYLFLGTADGFSSEPDWTVVGGAPHRFFGDTVASAGDLNGDGYGDVVVSGLDVARVYYGSAAGLSSVPSRSIDHWVGWAPSGTAATAVDLNGDGYSDLALKRQFWGVYVFSGGPDGIAAEPTWILEGWPDHVGWFYPPFFGDAIAPAGDVDGDGYEDLAIGALYHTTAITGQGRVYVYFGSPDGPSDERARVGNGIDLEENLGWSIAAGDLNGDGYADVCGGAPWFNDEIVGGDAGRVATYFGGPDRSWENHDWSVHGVRPNIGFGGSIAVADFNGDGFDDVVARGGGEARVFLGGPSGPGPTANWLVGPYERFRVRPSTVASAGDVDADGYEDLLLGVPGYPNESGTTGAVFLVRGRPNRPLPLAVCPPAARWECSGEGRASGLLDGSASVDPGGGPLSFDWSVSTCRLEGSGATVLAECPIGAHDFGLVVSAGGLDSRPCATRIVVEDTLAPRGGVTFPPSGSCHGPAETPVVVRDDFEDVCTPEIERLYTPAGGPGYGDHGDHLIRVSALDASGNAASSEIAFTVDLVSPRVRFLEPSDSTLRLPMSLPFAVLFESDDDDGASGTIVHETLSLDRCVLFDGRAYGDGDGLLSDEEIRLETETLCDAALRCGFPVLDRPELVLEAADCGGNRGTARLRLPIRLRLRPGICGR